MTDSGFDIIIVGSGPAGISAAFPLVESGLRVAVLDGGREMETPFPKHPYLKERLNDPDQWQWMVGEEFYALRHHEAASPKLRTPTQAYVFEGFAKANRIDTKNFMAIGSLATGGLSGAWGCGVAKFDDNDFISYPFSAAHMEESYVAVSQRMGLSGSSEDDLSSYFGLDDLASPPVQINPIQEWLFSKYAKRKASLLRKGVRMGRSRVAVLTEDRENRFACNLSGNCLWGCDRGSLYTSSTDIPTLKRYKNFVHMPGCIAERVSRTSGYPTLEYVTADGTSKVIAARKIVLAAGTLATTRLALQAIEHRKTITVQSNPSAAFLLWIPGMLGRSHTDGFALGQLSLALSLPGEKTAYGSLFTPTGIPVSEFLKFVPLRKRYGIDILRNLMSSCLVGNLFLPGYLGNADATLTRDGTLQIEGRQQEEAIDLFKIAKRKLRIDFARMGTILVPMSFTTGTPGSDIHYAATLPMKENPTEAETNLYGELNGFEDLHVVDGACLTSLPEKPHTLTIMANAHRIGLKLASNLSNRA